MRDLEPVIKTWWNALEKEEKDLGCLYWEGGEPDRILEAIKKIESTCIDRINQLSKISPNTAEEYVIAWET